MNVPIFTLADADRLHRGIKNTSLLANPKNRVHVTQITLRDFQNTTFRASAPASQSTSGNGPVLLTDSSGNLFAMLDVQGAADGATLS